MRVPDDPSLDVGDSLTLEGWVKRDDARSIDQLFNKGSRGFQVVVLDRRGGNRVVLRKANVATVARSQGGVPADGRFHHVVVIKDGRQDLRIYIDGVEQALQVARPGQVIQDTSFPLTFSAATRPGAIRGDIDQFAVYDRALSAEQVATLFAAGTP